MSKFDNAMSRQVESLPELIEQQYEDLEPKTKIPSNTITVFINNCDLPSVKC